MVDRAQILKGLLDGCILKVVSQGEAYGIPDYIGSERKRVSGAE